MISQVAETLGEKESHLFSSRCPTEIQTRGLNTYIVNWKHLTFYDSCESKFPVMMSFEQGRTIYFIYFII